MTTPQPQFVPGAVTMSSEVEWTEPPSWPKVIGVLSIIFGSLGTLGGVCGAFMPMMMASIAPGQELPPTMRFGVGMWTMFFTGWVCSVVLLIGGVQCLRRRPSAKLLHLVYALHGIITVPISTAIQIQAQSEMKAWAAANPKNMFAMGQNQPGAEIGAIFGLGLGLVFGLAYPLFVTFWFGVYKRTHRDMLYTAPPADE